MDKLPKIAEIASIAMAAPHARNLMRRAAEYHEALDRLCGLTGESLDIVREKLGNRSPEGIYAFYAQHRHWPDEPDTVRVKEKSHVDAELAKLGTEVTELYEAVDGLEVVLEGVLWGDKSVAGIQGEEEPPLCLVAEGIREQRMRVMDCRLILENVIKRLEV